MGLFVSHDCYQGGYHGFTRWRILVARACGIPLMLMDGFYEGPPDWHPIIKESLAEKKKRELDRKANTPTVNEGTLMVANPTVLIDGVEPRWDGLGFWALDVHESLPLSWKLFKGDPIIPLLQHPDG